MRCHDRNVEKGWTPDDARRLAQLETEERTLSSTRLRLQDRIDFIRSGRSVETADTAAQLGKLLEEERELSGRRLELHAEIDALWFRLGQQPGPREKPRPLGSASYST